eukprot:NODE_203_length_12996_cov_1.033961.p3 type:complete len:509 gc:universal NODE_203_length_12996_cov_1.033961:2718-1192(-)
MNVSPPKKLCRCQSLTNKIFFKTMGLWKHIYLIGLIYVLVCPFTKVEEHFNLHAIYDMLNSSRPFDHEIYPGPVHRTFMGSIFISILSYIPSKLISLLYSGVFQGLLQMLTVRSLLYLLNAFAVQIFSTRLSQYQPYFLWIFYSQFHLPFYLSRTLPNSFAFPLAILGLTDLIGSFYDSRLTRNAIRFIVYAAAIFRVELVALLFGIIILERIQGRSVFRLVPIIIYDLLVAVAISISIDSYMWEVITWPEFSGFVYNIVFNKSSHWGISPWYQYIIDIIRICNLSLLFIPFAFNEKLSFKLSFLIIFVTGILSTVGHKEWRFIIYLFPLINVVSAIGMRRVEKKIGKLVYLIILGQFVISCFFSYVSSLNYFGGYASISFASQKLIDRPSTLYYEVLSDLVFPRPKINSSIWIDFGTKQSGATLFSFPNYLKIGKSDKQEPFYVSFNMAALNLNRVDVPDKIENADYFIQTNPSDLKQIWCVTGFDGINFTCKNIVCISEKACLYKK